MLKNKIMGCPGQLLMAAGIQERTVAGEGAPIESWARVTHCYLQSSAA